MGKIRVLIADDHVLFREGLKSILQRAGERFQVVGEAGSGLEAQELALRLKPDIILMDVRMPNGSGLEATRALTPCLPDTKIIMLTISDNDEDLFEAIKAGAKGYLLKTSANAAQLIAALESVAADQVILTPTMAIKLAAEFAAMARQSEISKPSLSPLASPDVMHDARLTEREREVLELVAQGLTNKEIGKRLYISENTVRTHLRNILDKLQVHNRAQAAASFVRHDL